MDRIELKELAEKFYQAIINAKPNFSPRDRMSKFPSGCCDDVSDLFAYYLQKNFNVSSKQCNGRYADENIENITNHVWLIVDEFIVDLTYGQFHIGCTTYIGNKNNFYRSFEDIFTQENYDIEKDRRLWEDYQEILKYIE